MMEGMRCKIFYIGFHDAPKIRNNNGGRKLLMTSFPFRHNLQR